MRITNKHKSEVNISDTSTLEKTAEAWVRLCLFHIKQKKQLGNQYQNKKYEYHTE